MIKYTQARCEKYMLVQLLQMCPNLGKPMDCDLPGSSVHGNFQATILEWVAIPICRGSSDPGIKPACPASLTWVVLYH